MSSILKALKKIEEETPSPETFPSLPQPIGSRQHLHSKSNKKRHLGKILIVLILLVMVGAAAVIFLSQRGMNIANILPSADTSDKKSTAAVTASENKIYKAKITSAHEKAAQLQSAANRHQKNKPKSPINRSSAGQFQASKPSYPVGAAGNQEELKSSVLKPRAKPEPNVQVEKPLKKTPALPNVTAAEKPSGRKNKAPIAPAATAANTPPRTPARAAYDRIEDSKLKLQALAWSADDARRMAVINGRIVREGESVDGYQIMQIRQEDVVVSDGGKSWRLEFGIQR